MADLTAPVPLAKQIRLVAKLRWLILRSSIRKKGQVADLIGMGFVAFFGLLTIIGPCFLFYFWSNFMVSQRRLQGMPWPFWIIFVFWQVFPIFAAGFGTAFDFRALLRFPFNVSAFYIISLAYGFADFPALASVCWLLAMTAGAATAMPSLLPTLLLVFFLFILLNVTLERLLASWLERLLARRRSREIFFALFILSMFSLQLIGPIQQRMAHRTNPLVFTAVLKYLAPFPPALAARAITAAMRHDFANILVGLSGLTASVTVVTAALWRRTAAQYRGEEFSESAAPVAVASAPISSNARVAATQPASLSVSNRQHSHRLLSPAVAAVTRKEYLYLIRNGFAFVLLILPPAQILLFTSQFAVKHPQFAGKHPFFGAINTDFFFPAMMAYTVLVLMGPAYNAFAYEGRGIQTYFTAPLKFADILAAKNLISAAVLTFEVFVCSVVLSWRIGPPSFPIMLATAFALIFTIAGQLPVANWASLTFPRRLEFGSMRGQRNSGVAVWLMFGMQIVMAGISALILMTSRWTGNPWLPVEAFAFLAAAALSGYFASLRPLTDLAEKKKETLIDALCR
jgi:ABC-2 type transport system permease protein